MKIMEHTYKERIYEFMLTMAAKAEIDDLQFKVFEKLKNPEMLNVIAEQEILNNDVNRYSDELKTLKETNGDGDKERIIELEKRLTDVKENQKQMVIKMLPSMKDYSSLMRDQIDPVEVAIILLKNNRKYRDEMTDTLAAEIIEDMEYSLGFELFNEKMDELIDKVFTILSQVQGKRDKVMEKINKPKEKINDNQKLMN